MLGAVGAVPFSPTMIITRFLKKCKQNFLLCAKIHKVLPRKKGAMRYKNSNLSAPRNTDCKAPFGVVY